MTSDGVSCSAESDSSRRSGAPTPNTYVAANVVAGRVNPIKPHAPELRERGYQMFARRMPLAKIGEALDVPADTVRKWSSKGKWKARLLASGGRANGAVIPAHGAAAVPTSEDIDAQLAKLIALPFAEKQQAYLDLMANESLRAALAIQSVPHAALVQNSDKIKKLDEVARKALRLEENKPQVVVNVGLLAQASGVTRLIEKPAMVIAEQTLEKDAVSEQKLTVES